jgi:hypothetical protein
MAGLKYDSEKHDLSIVPLALDEACARALTFGANKYGRNNYRGGMQYTRLIAACMRHLKAWNERESNDSESSLSHLDHAVACLAMLCVMESTPSLKSAYDNRDLNEDN